MKSKRLFLFILFLALGAAFCFFWWREIWLERSQDKVIAQASRRYRVPFPLVKSVVWKESRFHPETVGRAGEKGLMQLMPPAASEWTQAEKIRAFETSHLFDPETNVLAGTWYLGKLLQRYAKTDNPAVYALADYNAGRGNVLRWNKGPAATNSALFLEQITFPGTKNYIISILDRSHRYQEPAAGVD